MPLSAIAPRIGIRETRPIVGEYQLTEEDVFNGRNFADGIAKGCHHIDIPLRSLMPKKLNNMLNAGRCLSADQPAYGTSRLMGNCLAMEQATGSTAALFVDRGLSNIRDVSIVELLSKLTRQGAILEGPH
ncbi:MAG: FAD-dependent oxidoreductase [Devosiaceae bacterium]|nr:FAD-dependent oxidoreductase [Devosiaceae bacterium]